jgi:hypothetical protein
MLQAAAARARAALRIPPVKRAGASLASGNEKSRFAAAFLLNLAETVGVLFHYEIATEAANCAPKNAPKKTTADTDGIKRPPALAQPGLIPATLP